MRTFIAILLVLLFCGISSEYATAQQTYGQAEAEAVRQAVAQVQDAVVRIELVGVAAEPGGTEVASDAPTVGTIVDPEGWIIASSLVTARPAASTLVVFADGSRATAKVVAQDRGRELVLLKVETEEPLPAIDWYLEKPATVGQYAIAVGRVADEGSPAISVGIVSARDRLWGKALQTDARISPAFYGGPLIDILGNVLGIVVPAVPSQGGAEEKTGWYDSGIGFAIDSQSIRNRLEKMRAGDDIEKGLLGIVSADPDPYSAGTTIETIRPRSPAEKAGLRGGDTIEKVAGQPVSRYYQIRQVLGRFDAGDAVDLVIRREDQQLDLQATLVSDIPPFAPQLLGIYGQETEQGIRIRSIVPDSPAATSDLKRGDVISQLQDREVPSTASLRRRVMSHDPEAPLQLTYFREGKSQQVSVKTRSVAGMLGTVTPPPLAAADASSDEDEAVEETTWKETNLTLPDVPNKAVYLAPADVDSDSVRGLLIVMANPGDAAGTPPLDRWRETAKELQVAVAIVFAADNNRWTPPESDVAGQIAAKLANRLRLDRSAVGVTGETAGPSFAMAVVVALTQAESISGVFASTDMQPPAIRLTENDPAIPSQIAMPLTEEADLPGWAKVLPRVGYPVVRTGDAQPSTILKWVVTLSRI